MNYDTIMQTLMHFNTLDSKTSGGNAKGRTRYGPSYQTLDPDIMLGTFPNMIEEQNYVENDTQYEAH